jgi:general secretion pathway protein A
MDQQFFNFMGLREDPFHVSPDPRFYYFSPAHEAALADILYGIESRKGLMVLTGEAGTGKTSLLNLVLDWLKRRGRSCAFLFHTRLEPIGLLRIILSDFGVACESRSKSELVKTLHNWLVQRHMAGDLPVLILDEAQALPPQTLDELRLLLNLETPRGKLLQIVLSGQPELDEKLRLRGLRQLHQRVMCHSRLPVLTEKETAAYISTRLATAHCSNTAVFPNEVVQEIYRCSDGIPRVVNLLCEHALISAYAQQQHVVTPEMVQRIAVDFDLTAKPLGATDEELEASYERFGAVRALVEPESLAKQYKTHWWSQIEFDAWNRRAAAGSRETQQAGEDDPYSAVAVADPVETPEAVEAVSSSTTVPEPGEALKYWRRRRSRSVVEAFARNSVSWMRRGWQGLVSALVECVQYQRKLSHSFAEFPKKVTRTRAPSATPGRFRQLSTYWWRHRAAMGGAVGHAGAAVRRGWHSLTDPTISYVRSVLRSFVHDGRMLLRVAIPPTPALEQGSSMDGGERKPLAHRNVLAPIRQWLSQPITSKRGKTVDRNDNSSGR